MDIFRSLHPTIAEYTFFSSFQGTFNKMSHLLVHKKHFNKFNGKKIVKNMLSDYHGIELEITIE